MERIAPTSIASTVSEGKLEIGIADARRMYLLLEDLASYLHRSDICDATIVLEFKAAFKERVLVENQQVTALITQARFV